MWKRCLPAVTGLALSLILSSILYSTPGEEPCACESLWPHSFAYNVGRDSQICIDACNVLKTVDNSKCKSGAWCYQCNTAPENPLIWCVWQECGVGNFRTYPCPRVSTN